MSKNSLFIALFSLLAWTGLASATTISQLDGNYGRTINGIGQTFTATGTSYDSIGVFLYPSTANYTDTTVSFSLFTGTTFSQAPATWTDIDLSTLTPDGRLTIDVGMYTFSPGMMYSFAIHNDTNDWLVRHIKDSTDHYCGGAMYLAFNGSFYPTSSYQDLKFEITAHPTPLPSTLALFSTGLFGLIPALIRKFKQN